MHPGLKIIVCLLGTERSAESADALRVDSVTHGFEATLEEIDSHLDIITATAKLAGHQPFRGAGRGDDALGKALEAVAQTMNVPLATINLLDDERHRDEGDAYKLTELIVERGTPLVINAGKDGGELAENSYLQSNGVDFYAGVPLTLDNGLTVGSLVIIDYEERGFGEDELMKLQELGADLVARFGNAPAAAQPVVAANLSSKA
jgi:GAF domain-containing protein